MDPDSFDAPCGQEQDGFAEGKEHAGGEEVDGALIGFEMGREVGVWGSGGEGYHVDRGVQSRSYRSLQEV